MLRPPDIVDNEILIVIDSKWYPSSTDITFTGKAPHFPRVKTAKITF